MAIPEQYSLVGFDDTDALLHAHGQNMLTTIHLPLEEIGREAARLMIMQVTSGMVENAEIILPPELISAPRPPHAGPASGKRWGTPVFHSPLNRHT